MIAVYGKHSVSTGGLNPKLDASELPDKWARSLVDPSVYVGAGRNPRLWRRKAASTSSVETARIRETVIGDLPVHARCRGMIVVSLAFVLLGFTLAAMLAHMVPMLGSLGLGAAAVVIGSLSDRRRS